MIKNKRSLRVKGWTHLNINIKERRMSITRTRKMLWTLQAPTIMTPCELFIQSILN